MVHNFNLILGPPTSGRTRKVEEILSTRGHDLTEVLIFDPTLKVSGSYSVISEGRFEGSIAVKAVSVGDVGKYLKSMNRLETHEDVAEGVAQGKQKGIDLDVLRSHVEAPAFDCVVFRAVHIYTPDLLDVIKKLTEKTDVIATGRGENYAGVVFPTILALRCVASRVDYLFTSCSVCGKEAYLVQAIDKFSGNPAYNFTAQALDSGLVKEEPKCLCHFIWPRQAF